MGARGTRSLYDYDDVAFTCRVAHTRGESMVLAVEVEFDVSTIVARGLINRARRAGYSIPHVRPDKVQTDFDGYEPVSLDLFEGIKATKGTPVADLLKGLADDAGLKLNVPTIDGDPKFAAQLEDILKEHQ